MFRFINNMHDKSQIVAWKIHFQHSPLSETRFKQILSSGIFEFYDCPEIGSRKLFKSTLNNRLHRNLACVIDKSSRGAKLKRAFEELPQ